MTQTKLPELDLFARDVREQPDKALAQTRSEGPLAWSPHGYVVVSFDLAQKVLRDQRFTAGALRIIEEAGITEGPVHEYRTRSLIMSVDERHMRLRVPMARFLGPAKVAGMRDAIRGIVDDLFSAVDPSAPVEFHSAVDELVAPLTYCYLSGAPASDARKIGRLSEVVLTVLDRDPSLTPMILDAYDELFEYIDEKLVEKRRSPGDDMLSFFIEQERAGKLSSIEVRDEAVSMLEASSVNTAYQIGLTVWALLSRPKVWERLVADPSLIPAAINEAIRLYARPGVITKVAREDAEIDGVPVAKGSMVFISLWAANRDPARFEDPDTFDLDREQNQPMTFSTGAYGCLGQSLARLEIEEVVRHIVVNYPNAQLLPQTEMDNVSTFHRWVVKSLQLQLSGPS